ncbi:amino acid adenylation domain-containing protein [Clostridium sp.]|uniref:non-ribosomal peptide synthetase n=1 Tax=Clostridium sp. TaxID=1506 RepID=UPI003217C8AD
MIVKKFIEQVEANPNNIAIKTNYRAVTYKELNNHANYLASELISAHNNILKSKSVANVALLFEHGEDMIIGTVGAIKANLTYVPIEPSYPMERLKYIVNHGDVKIILTNSKNLAIALTLIAQCDEDIKVININDIKYTDSDYELDEISENNEIAYIMYTSGSTGKPKGVYQSYNNLFHFINCYAKTLDITKDDRLTLFSSLCHDASLMDIYVALLNGATLYPVNIKDVNNFTEIYSWLQLEKITVWHSVPTVYRYLIKVLTEKETFNDLRYIVLGGEEIINNDIEMFKLYFNNTKLINLYGQTESSFNSAKIFELGDNNRSITLGQAVDETELVVIDENREEAPPFKVGEIVVISKYISLGYWKDKELTEKTFKFDTYGESLYFTGDLGRTLENGEIEFIGRKNSLIKIRGYRVDIGDIESNLLKNQNIEQVAVINANNSIKGEEDSLVAFLVSAKDLNIDEIRRFISTKVPEYMIPNRFIQIDKLPTTQSGKIDRKFLMKNLVDINTKKKYLPPTNETEKKLVEIWSEILSLRDISIDDNFFELGGHSLKATLLINNIHKELNIEIKLKDLFEHPTIKGLSKCIANSKKSKYIIIERLQEKEYYKISSAQKRIYMLQQFNKDSIAYNMPMVFELEGKINKNKMEDTFKRLVLRHEALRTYFETIEGEIVQKIDNSYEFKLIEKKSNEDNEIDSVINKFIRPFELEKAPLFRIEFVEGKEKTYLLIDMHHIISDAFSIQILIKEFTILYNSEDLEPLKLQYKDFAAWQNDFLKSEEIKKQEEYWINKFSDEVPVLNLPYDYERPVIKSFEGNIISFEVNKEITEALRNLAKETGTTMHMVLLSVFNILLSKYSGQDDIVVGIPVAGRLHADLQNIMGMFVNTLALRNNLSKDKSYIEFLKEVKENLLNSYENQSYQFEELINKINIKRDTSRNPLFDVVFNMLNVDFHNDLELDELILKQQRRNNKVSKFDLTFYLMEVDNRLEFRVEYCTKIFKEETITRMCEHFIELCKNICKNSKNKISDIKMLTEKEENKLLYEFNDTKINYPKDKTIHELFEYQVEKTPDNIAVVFEDKKLTYKELNEKANCTARVLRDRGVKADSIIGIMVERSLEMIIGIMGVLKAGGAYLPIDPNYPEERIEYMLSDSNSKMLLSTANILRAKELDFSGQVIDISNEEIFKVDSASSNLEKINNFSNLAYVIYTSGTTGNPKGVMIEHRQLNNFIHGITNETSLIQYSSILCITTISFDIFALETLLPLTKGLKIVVANNEEHVNGEKLGNLIEINEVEIMQVTPSRLKFLLENTSFKKSLSLLKLILIGGEALPDNLIQELKYYNHLKVYNVYGPTETTVWSTIKLIKNNEKITIGKPISNTSIYIINKNNELVPVGVVGELCIGGDGLARGYLNRPELTSKKFVDNPFETGTKMYITGDLARWLPNGDIEFLGRTDNQVKIRGFRIELGEIENALLNHEDVKEAVVLAKDDNKYLCAYIVSDRELSVRELRKYLKTTLPEYMIPNYFIKVPRIPLTINGKIDKNNLLNIETKKDNATKILPRSLQENIIVEIWKNVLNLDDIYVNDDFFELGGNSINIIQVVKEIKDRLDVEVTVADLMINTKVADLVEHITKNGNTQNEYKHIFKINNSTSDKNIFIIHGADGDIFYYRYLAKLLEEKYSVYGIQPSGLTGREPLPESFYEMINDYIKEIRKFQSEGPYILAGYCIGGYFARDIAKVFELQGEKIGSIIEIDQEPYVKHTLYKPIKKCELLLKLLDSWRKIMRKDKNYTIEKYKKILEKKHKISNERQIELISDRSKLRIFLMDELMSHCNYIFFSRKIKAPTLVVKAEDNHHKLFETECWDDMVSGNLEFYEIPGGHETLVLPPYVDKLAEIILDYLDRTIK